MATLYFKVSLHKADGTKIRDSFLTVPQLPNVINRIWEEKKTYHHYDDLDYDEKLEFWAYDKVIVNDLDIDENALINSFALLHFYDIEKGGYMEFTNGSRIYSYGVRERKDLKYREGNENGVDQCVLLRFVNKNGVELTTGDPSKYAFKVRENDEVHYYYMYVINAAPRFSAFEKNTWWNNRGSYLWGQSILAINGGSDTDTIKDSSSLIEYMKQNTRNYYTYLFNAPIYIGWGDADNPDNWEEQMQKGAYDPKQLKDFYVIPTGEYNKVTNYDTQKGGLAYEYSVPTNNSDPPWFPTPVMEDAEYYYGHQGYASFVNFGGSRFESDLYGDTLQKHIDFFDGAETTTDPQWDTDPDIPSGPGGGGGSYDGSSDKAGGIEVPTLQGTALGFITSYNVTTDNLKALASKLWGEDFIDKIKNIFTKPMDAIISLQMTPVNATGISSTIKLANYDTEIEATKLNRRYYVIDLGTIQVTEYEGSYMDYDPHTKVHLFLPFIGIQQLNANEVIGASINIQYCVDVLTGSCVAVVRMSRGVLNSVLYTYSGSCNMSIPVTSLDFSSQFSGIINGLSSTVGGQIATSTAMQEKNLGGAIQGSLQTAGGIVQAGASGIMLASGLGNVSHSGGLGSSTGLMNSKEAYLIIERQLKAYPDSYKKYRGRTSEMTLALSSCSGFTVVKNIDLSGVTCTEDERNEIDNLLKGGVFI